MCEDQSTLFVASMLQDTNQERLVIRYVQDPEAKKWGYRASLEDSYGSEFVGDVSPTLMASILSLQDVIWNTAIQGASQDDL